ncbi:MAG: adenylate/guanylate cyclase domain-containing protein [Acidimicrobiia bacterium]
MELSPRPANTRVWRAFAFVDVCGFTALIDERGDDAAVEALHASRRHVRDACGHYGVRVAKWLGDGAMIVGVDAEQLACAAFEIVATDLDDHHRPRTRAGMAVGEVLVFEGDDYIGRVVNQAARLCDAAGAGELLAGTTVAPWLPPSLHLRHVRPIDVHGFRSRVEVGTVELSGEVQRLQA